MLRVGFLLVALVLSGCAVKVPAAHQPGVDRTLSGRDVLAAPGQHGAKVVVLGGEVVEVRNASDRTELEVLERPLSGDVPRRTDESSGRFLVRSSHFLDPAIYKGRRVTVVGPVVGDAEGRIGDRPYRFAVIEASAIHLWPRLEPATAYHAGPYWVDPWWPYGGWPYYHRHPLWYRRHHR